MCFNPEIEPGTSSPKLPMWVFHEHHNLNSVKIEIESFIICYYFIDFYLTHII